MHIIPGETVAVQGLGGLGHLAIQYAARMGYRVVALSSSGEKKDFAMKLGAHDYIDGSKEDTVEALKKLGGATLVVSTAPNAKVMGPLLGALNAAGKLLILGGESMLGTRTWSAAVNVSQLEALSSSIPP